MKEKKDITKEITEEELLEQLNNASKEISTYKIVKRSFLERGIDHFLENKEMYLGITCLVIVGIAIWYFVGIGFSSGGGDGIGSRTSTPPLESQPIIMPKTTPIVETPDFLTVNDTLSKVYNRPILEQVQSDGIMRYFEMNGEPIYIKNESTNLIELATERTLFKSALSTILGKKVEEVKILRQYRPTTDQEKAEIKHFITEIKSHQANETLDWDFVLQEVERQSFSFDGSQNIAVFLLISRFSILYLLTFIRIKMYRY